MDDKALIAVLERIADSLEYIDDHMSGLDFDTKDVAGCIADLTDTARQLHNLEKLGAVADIYWELNHEEAGM